MANHLVPSPLERWFTRHPGPHAHGLAGTAAAAPGWKDFEALLPFGWEAGIDLGYGEPEGDPALRERLADDLGLPGRQNVLLTQGAVEANWLALATLLGPGSRVIVQTPIYPQLPCLAQSLGATVRPWTMPDDPAAPAELGALVGMLEDGADLLVLNTPHNPTGRVFSDEDMATIVRMARASGCVLLVDEVYRCVGEGPMPARALTWGPEGVLASNSFSKALALPGLRVGWLAGDADIIERAVPWREHTTLALAGPAVAIAGALWPRRQELLDANRALIASNRQLVLSWLGMLPGWSGRAPTTAGVLLCGPDDPMDDVAVAEAWYRKERGMVLPGSTCGYPGRFRIGFGHRDAMTLAAALGSFAAHAAPKR